MEKINLELVKEGFANGVAKGRPLTEEEKIDMIIAAEEAFGKFLDALKVDWREDPNSDKTPYRVAKAYVNDLWAGRYEAPPSITTFPSDGYDGMVFEGGIPLTSMCSHHHQTIMGKVHVAYIQCRGVKHGGATMKTSKLTGAFKKDPSTRNEFYEFVKGY